MAKQRIPKAVIIEGLLALKEAVEAEEGHIIYIGLDKKGNEALRNELDVSVSCSKRLLGIVIEVAQKCSVCGQDIPRPEGMKCQVEEAR